MFRSTGPISNELLPGLARRLPSLFPALALALACGGTSAPTGSDDPGPPPGDADVVVEAGVRHQAIDGFGATTLDLVYQFGEQDNLPPSLRQDAVRAAYGEVGLDLGTLSEGNIETENDDADPANFRWDGFRFGGMEAMKEKLVDPARAHGFSGAYPSLKVNTRFTLSWMRSIRSEDYDRYLDEVAEFVAAGVIGWSERDGGPPEHVKLFNEPLSGNRELTDGTPSEVADIVARVGERLEAEGYGEVGLLVPGGETVRRSLETARAVLGHGDASRHVSALTYHAYRGPYKSISDILATSGRGQPDAEALRLRRELRSLAREHGIPLWMSEITYGGAGATSMDALRGRAIHVHDELVHAGASAFFGMNNLWDSRSQREHFGNDDLLSETGTIALIDLKAGEVIITSMGRAIGHYARWVDPGAVRVEAASRDSLVQVSAFRDDARGRFSAVLINNHPEERTVRVDVSGLSLTGPLQGEASAADRRWDPLDPVAVEGGASFTLTLPGHGVVSVAGSY